VLDVLERIASTLGVDRGAGGIGVGAPTTEGDLHSDRGAAR